MINFDEPQIRTDKSAADNIKELKGYFGDLVDKLNMLSETVEKINKNQEREGK